MARVLIADDAMFMRATMRKTLEDDGHEIVAEADNGMAALRQFRQSNPDIVLLDITMPEMDGLTALCEMLKINPSARILMCTALGQEQKIMEALQKGACDYLVKPFSPEKLSESVRRAMEP